MNGFNSITLRTPQDFIDNAPPITPVQGYNNQAERGFFRAQQIPGTMLDRPRMITTLNQNYIGRYMGFPGTQTDDEAYQPHLRNRSVPLEVLPLRNIRGIQQPMFSKY